jgi:polyisoprenoid-binding protein YceI
MTRNSLVLTASIAALAAFAVPASAQTKMSLKQDSKLELKGGSNVHDWECSSTGFQATVEMDSSYMTLPLASMTKPIGKVSVVIPVKSLKCGKGKMDDNMYKALKADQFPEIKYVLDSYRVEREKSTADGFAALTTGEITVAGKTVKVEFPLTAVRGAAGAMKGTGSVALKMTDFGIKPPVALLGTLRTKDEITVTFNVLLDKAVVVALQQR